MGRLGWLGYLVDAPPQFNQGADDEAIQQAQAAVDQAVADSVALQIAQSAGGSVDYQGGAQGMTVLGPPFSQDAMIPGPGDAWWPRNVNQRLFPDNLFDVALDDERRMWEVIQRLGGLKLICPGQKYAMPPWVKQPEQGRRFSKISSIPLPGVEQTDFLVATMQVPLGYDGVIPSVVQIYTGMGFAEGSGDIVWRIQLNQRYEKDYGNTKTSIGSLNVPYPANSGAIRLLSGQTVNYFVSLGAGALGNLVGGRIVCAMFGWFYPR
jgi:hypothetical protein